MMVSMWVWVCRWMLLGIGIGLRVSVTCVVSLVLRTGLPGATVVLL